MVLQLKRKYRLILIACVDLSTKTVAGGCFIIVHLQPFIRDFSSKGTAHTVTSVSCMSEKLASCATKR